MAATKADLERELIEAAHQYRHDPLGFVRYAWDDIDPHDWQRDVMQETGRQLQAGEISTFEAVQMAVASGHGIGKLQAYDDRVPTPSGMRRWGDLIPGDAVFGANGSPTIVQQMHHFQSVPMYRVTFDDGAFLEVSSGHLWNVRGRQERRKKLDTWRTLETIEIFKLGVKRPNGSALARQWEIPIQGAAQFEAREIDLHPYVLGVWLGDGVKGRPEYSKPYPELTDKVRGLGYEVIDRPDGNAKYIKYAANLFKGDVFDCGSHDRFIPDDYKFNSIENRLALFQGLCDSDGEVNGSGSIGYSTTSRQLADDVIWLARSLGCKAKLQPGVKKGWYSDGNGDRVECRDCYRITINAPFNPFTINHRKAAYKPSEPRYLVRWIDSIEPIGTADGMCITVAAQDGLYLADQFIVTHNSALVAWITLWAIATCPDTKGVVTANTETQLKTKTWAELAKWHGKWIYKHWFQLTATALISTSPGHDKTWRIDQIAWSERNTEAFAGLHNAGSRVLLVFDEASAIPDAIWEVSEGALTDEDTEILWVAFGNPTRNIGRFRECFGKFKHRWNTRQIDSRTVPGTNKKKIQEWISDYGEDSDFVRVRVRGLFPAASFNALLGPDEVDQAMAKEYPAGSQDYAAIILGVDVARQGDDSSCIARRRGKVLFPLRMMRIPDTMLVASQVSQEIDMHRADAAFVDETGGYGAGVVDALRQIKKDPIGVQFSGKPIDQRYFNKRSEMYFELAKWVKSGGQLPNDEELKEELCATEYTFQGDKFRIIEKDDIKDLIGRSPDKADAVALTFAFPVSPKNPLDALRGSNAPTDRQRGHDPMKMMGR